MPASVPLIINDHADVARAVGAAGVHVGQKDLSPEDCRLIVGPDAFVGQSISNIGELSSLSPAADHIGIGPVFPTGTKKDAAPVVGLDGLRSLLQHAPVPAVAIGGIHEGNARSVYETGVAGIAVVSAVCGKSDPEAAARTLLSRRPIF